MSDKAHQALNALIALMLEYHEAATGWHEKFCGDWDCVFCRPERFVARVQGIQNDLNAEESPDAR